jgi:hypothetical protein
MPQVSAVHTYMSVLESTLESDEKEEKEEKDAKE